MATLKKPMVATEQTLPGLTRFVPEQTISVLFADAAADKELPVGTVVAFNSSTNGYVEIIAGGATDTGQLAGIVYPDPVSIDDGGEVVGVIMTRGECHFDDLVADDPTEAELQTILREQALLRGILVKGLADIRHKIAPDAVV